MTAAASSAVEAGRLADIATAEASGDARALLAAHDAYLQIRPTAGWAWNNAGLAAMNLGERAAAEYRFLRALACPGFQERHMPHSNLAMLYLADDWVAAADQARESVRLAPQFGPGWWNLGNALTRGGRTREAVAVFEAAVQFCSNPPLAQLLEAKRKACLWEGLDALEARVIATALAGDKDCPPFMAFTYASTSAAQQKVIAERWARLSYEDSPPAWSRVRAAYGRIRLGYLSAGFGEHATSRLLVNTIENHDRARFVVIAFATGPCRDQAVPTRIFAAFDAVHPLFGLSDAEAAAAIRAQKIDILLDADGYTFGSRPQILARRPAPVQINYLAWPGTMGAPFIDYIVADRDVAPDPSAFSETVLYLDCYQPTDSRRTIAPPPPRAALGLPDDAVVVASMNAAWKLNPPLLDVWAGILRQAPNAVLWQLAGDESQEGLRLEARRRGIEDRLILAPVVDDVAHLARIAQADLALDPFPCGGHTTTSDLLWAGVPVVTKRGDSFCGAVSASLLRTVGLPELVTETLDAYVAAALAVIADADRRKTLKAHLTGPGRASRLFDNRRYVADLEAALTSIAR